MLSSVLNNPYQTVHLVVERTLHFLESALTPDLCNRLFNFITWVKLAIFQGAIQPSNSKEPKPAGAYVMQTELVP
jgi:hypothetical protein